MNAPQQRRIAHFDIRGVAPFLKEIRICFGAGPSFPAGNQPSGRTAGFGGMSTKAGLRPDNCRNAEVSLFAELAQRSM
jgi:hypothetical protein